MRSQGRIDDKPPKLPGPIRDILDRVEDAHLNNQDLQLEVLLQELPEPLHDQAIDEILYLVVMRYKLLNHDFPTETYLAIHYPNHVALCLRKIEQLRETESQLKEIYRHAASGTLGPPTEVPWNGQPRFRVLCLLRPSGQAYTYLAFDCLERQEVVLKISRIQSKTAGTDQCRFLREARALARARKVPYIVSLVGYDFHDEYACLVTTLVNGDALNDKYGDFSADDITSALILEKLARAVAEVHAEGIIHCDIKPQNIIIQPNGDPVLLDFGLSRFRANWTEASAIDDDDAPAFTRGYAAPEQLEADNFALDERTDICGLAGVLYFLATSKAPCETKPYREVDEALLRRTSLDLGLIEVCLKGLERRPSDRYRSARELADALSEWLCAESTSESSTALFVKSQSGSELTKGFTLRAANEVTEPRRTVSPESAARNQYLKDMRSEWDAIKEGLTQRALFLDLGISTPTDLVYSYHNQCSSATNVDMAFNHCHGRLLIIGSPGAGKTTTLLHIGLTLIKRAAQDPMQAIPLLLSLSEFQSFCDRRRIARRIQSSPAQSDLSSDFRDWIKASWPSVTGTAFFERWMSEGRVAYLFDGLDELPLKNRSAVLEAINCVIKGAGRVSVVVSCRTFEYEALSERRDNRLHLTGAIKLAPLTEEQIRLYLSKVSATGLATAMSSDMLLMNLAQTPFILSMMALAYQNRPAEEIPRRSSKCALRTALMNEYVNRAHQRVERRKRGLVCDNKPEHEIHPDQYACPPAALQTYLEWLATQLSRRNQISVSPSQLYELLRPPESASISTREIMLAQLCRFPLIFLFAFVMTAIPTPFSLLNIVLVTGSSAVSAFITVLTGIGSVIHPQDSRRKIYFCSFLIVWIAALAASLSHLSPGLIDAAPMSVVLMVISSAAFAARLSTMEDFYGVRMHVLYGGVLVSILGAIFVPASLNPPGGYLFAICLICAQYAWCIYLGDRTDGGTGHAYAVFFFIGTLLCALLATAFSLFPALLSLFFSSFFYAVLLYDHPLQYLPLLVAVTFVGTWLGGVELGVLSAFATEVAILTACIKKAEYVFGFAKLEVEECQRLLNKWFLTWPLKLLLLGLINIRMRPSHFFEYCADALLLQRSGAARRSGKQEFAFIHRIVRDHFALRRVNQQLLASAKNVRAFTFSEIEEIGEAAVEILAEYATRADAPNRDEAIKTLGRIGGDETFEFFLEMIRQDDAELRRVILLSAYLLRFDQKKTLLEEILLDPAPVVQMARIVLVTGSKPTDKRWISEEEIWLQRNATFDSYSDFLSSCVRYFKAKPLDALISILEKDDDLRMRSKAVWLLGQIGGADALKPVMNSLGDVSSMVVLEGCHALGALRDFRVIAPLVQFGNSRPRFRAFVAMALGELGDQSVCETLMSWNQLSDQFAHLQIETAIAKLQDLSKA